MLTCKDATHLISESHERSLTIRERWALKLHLMMCVYCRRFQRQLVLMRKALREWGRRAADEDTDVAEGAQFTPEARERIRQTLTGGRER